MNENECCLAERLADSSIPPPKSSGDLIAALSIDLDKMANRMHSASMNSINSHEDRYANALDPCDCCEELEARLTGKVTNFKRNSNASDRSRISLDVLSNATSSSSTATQFCPSPISPSKAVGCCNERFNVINGCCSKLIRSRTPLPDHQICFDMETSLDPVNAIWAKDFGSPLKRFDSNGNKKMNHSLDDSSGVSSCTTAIDSLQPTHRATHRFIPRHDDEILLDIGDPIYVDYEAEDLWCIGINMRTSQRGIFPVAHVFEIDFEEECGPISSLKLTVEDKATFYLTFLGSVEVAHHKGNDVLVQAINKVLHFYQSKEEIVVPHSVLLDVSFRGIHIIDKSRKTWFQCPAFDYFYSLQNISFCGAHPKQLRYFGFISKHPLLPRFACNVFLSNSTTQTIVDAIGKAFKRSYDEYMAFAHPTEDIFID